MKCGNQIPDDALFCSKCGASTRSSSSTATAPTHGATDAAQTGTYSGQQVPNSQGGVSSLKCPGCGAPLVPKLGEMVITCEYCGGSVSMGHEGWQTVQKHTMLPIRLAEQDQVLQKVRDVMNQGMFHKHRQEKSKLEEITLSVVPYWLIPSSASSTVTFMWGETQGTQFGSGNQSFNVGGGQVINKTAEVDNNYDFPVVAVKAMKDYQPKDYQFILNERTIFDSSKLPKGVKTLNGDVSEEQAKFEAKTLVKQLQYQKAHDLHKHHTIERIETTVDVTDGELLHAPIWHVRYDHEGKKIILVVDANAGGVMSASGL
ncbi:MAG: zinc-ribbon domain-containing protein [Nitrososphaerota archaeon]|nr:zinc-ribbon domain-containing protein [Nitrososphaerota archaeon]